MPDDNWVDFKDIKARATMELALGHYGLLDGLKGSGKNLVGRCPIHKGSNPRQFSVNTERNIWNCFGNCKSGGNVLDFVAKMENVSLRKAGLILKNSFLADTFEPDHKSPEEGIRETKGPERQKPAPSVPQENSQTINPPLKFELKTLQTEHPFFSEREILPSTVDYFGLGFCTKGIMKNRIAIPIHNAQGELIAYCGRAVSEEQIEKEGKYKLPANFKKSAALYNLHRQREKECCLILVESFFSVYRLFKFGFPNTVALMGSVLSEIQEKLLAKTLGSQGQAVLMFDADADGQACTQDCLARLSKRFYIKTVDISPYGLKPHQLTFQQIAELI